MRMLDKIIRIVDDINEQKMKLNIRPFDFVMRANQYKGTGPG